MVTRNARIALGLAVAGFAAIVAAWLLSRSGGGIPGWEPVDTELHATIVSLHANETDQESPSPVLRQPAKASAEPSPPVSTASTSSTAQPTLTEPSSSPATILTSQPSEASRPSPDPSDVRLDLNAATQAQLEDLPGIGPSKAKAIIAYRDRKGGFRSVDDLLQVKGIGPKMFEKLRPEVAVR